MNNDMLATLFIYTSAALLWLPAFGGEPCSSELCNYAGDCELIDNKPNCSCYEESFEGKFCEKMKDYCHTDRNVCANKLDCVSYIGQTVCQCQGMRSGFDCRILEPLATTKAMCSYNVRATYGVKEKIVLSFENLGDVPVEFTIWTPTYLIAQVSAKDFKEGSDLKHTTDLAATLRDLGIRHNISHMSYKSAFYFEFSAKHFTLGKNDLNIRIETFDLMTRTAQPYVQNMTLAVHVVLPRNVACIPTISLRYGLDPTKPRVVDVNRFTNLFATVKARCIHPIVPVRFKWSVSDHTEKTLYYETDISESSLLKIPRFRLWFDAASREYSTFLLVVRVTAWETRNHVATLRCYLNVTALDLVADIIGGLYREVHEHQRFVLDGSQSREPGKPIGVPQRLRYSWECKSEDEFNPQCRTYMGDGAVITIPGYNLKAGFNYTYTLRIYSLNVARRMANISQVIHVVNDFRPVHINVICVRNCKLWTYSPGELLHLLALCEDCESPIEYKWTMNSKDMQQNKRRFVYKVPNDDTIGDLFIRLEVKTARQRNGVHVLVLKQNKAPTNGTCSIEPKHGQECQTNFHVVCKDFVDSNPGPILYVYTVNGAHIHVIGFGEARLFLIEGGSLNVSICDSQFACTTLSLSYTVDSMELPNSLEEIDAFFKKYDFKRMLRDGPRDQAFCLFYRLSLHKATAAIVKRYYREFGKDRSKTLMEMVWLLNSATNFLHQLKPVTHDKAQALTLAFVKLARTFDFLQKDREVLDLLTPVYFGICQTITTIMSMLSDETEHSHKDLMVKDFDDPFSEDNKDWLSLDPTVAVRVSSFQLMVSLTFFILKQIGLEAPRFHNPGEEAFLAFAPHVGYKVEVFEHYGPIEFVSNSTNCKIIVPLESVIALRRIYKSNHLLIQSVCHSSNVNWWAPEVWHPTTAIFTASFFSLHAAPISPYHTKLPFTLELKRVIYDVDDYDRTDYLIGNIIVYRTKLPVTALLLVKFLKTTANLRVLLTLNEKPSLGLLRTKGCLITRGQHNRTLIMRSFCTAEGIVYMAVYRADPFDKTPAHFTFRMNIQECIVWDNKVKNPLWVSDSCYPKNTDIHPEVSICEIDHLSTFAAKEYPVMPFPLQKGRRIMEEMPINVASILFYCLIFLAAFGILFWGRFRRHPQKMNLIRVIPSREKEEPHKLETTILHLRTGGMLLAQTSANVKLVFRSDLGRYKVIIYQNPLDPHLLSNTSCMVRLSNKKLQLPCMLTISHDGNGQYPRWFCRSIQVDDLKHDLSYTFEIHRWIRKGEKVRVSCFSDEINSRLRYPVHRVILPTRRLPLFKARFRKYTKFYYTNWFFMQPVFGPFRFTDDSLNIYERSCIWICKMVVTTCIVAIYFRRATVENYYNYQHMTVTFSSEILAVAIGSYFVTVLFDVLFDHLART
ncbi:uncharacterized protein LOC115632622 [Scaptodrosophila lebanonensis]|uniref:Uncharacterized protein LOC115632622 n=1 Tax=Drosophila lebanonensis TaxID=7225 RepID=A0A6J2UBG8_DROLE|nr:uncharacterized protein LOC115632622 [Scaptodrosophila lebanonensis]